MNMGNVHLVTGHAGYEHVTSADMGAFNAEIFGGGQFVFNRGNKFAASIITNNQIRVLDGDMYMQGRHIRLDKDTYVDLTIENGAQGMLRNDLIVARYTRDSMTGVEGCNLAVIKGTPAASGPKDPEHTSGDLLTGGVTQNDFPLYRVPLNGLNIQALVPLFDVWDASLEDMQEHATRHSTDGEDPIRPGDIGAAAATHASRHKAGGADPISAVDIGAWAENAQVATDCNEDIQSKNGKVFVRKYNSSTLNTPYKEGKTTYAHGVIITYALSSSYGTQIGLAGGKVFSRRLVNSSVTEWAELATTDYAVPLDGSRAMTGNLTVEKASNPSLVAKNTTTGRTASLVASAGGQAHWYNQKDSSNRQFLCLNAETAGLADAIQLQRQTPDGGTKLYNILHTGNFGELGAIQTAYGSYTGTGLYGAENPTSVTLPFPAKMLIVAPAVRNFWDSYLTAESMLLWTAGVQEDEGPSFGYGRLGRYFSESEDEDGWTLSWYVGDQNEGTGWNDAQMNNKSMEYNYIAWG